MDPIERVSDAVAALAGRDMTREDCHQFILEAAQMMEPVKPIIIGGSEQEETHIRWRTPDRSLRLSVRGTTIHSSFGDTRLIENDEYYNLESEEPEYKPYRWMIALGPEIQEIDIRSKPCTMCSCWDQFDAEFDRSMSDLVDGLGMMPPQWRPQIRYQWDLRVSRLGVLTASVRVDGVELASDATGETVLLPPGFPLGFGRVLAGLAGGARLRDVPMLASGGLAVTPLSPNGSESPEEIEEFDWFEEENEQGYAPDSQENRRPALSFAQLRDLAAQVASPESSAGSREEAQTVPMRTGLAFGQVCGIVDQWARGVPVRDVLVANGGVAGQFDGRDVSLVGDGWIAQEKASRGEWVLTVSPTPARTRVEPRAGAAAAWQLCQTMTQMFGAARFGETEGDAVYSRLYALGERGVRVRKSDDVTITFGDFLQLAPVEFAQ